MVASKIQQQVKSEKKNKEKLIRFWFELSTSDIDANGLTS